MKSYLGLIAAATLAVSAAAAHASPAITLTDPGLEYNAGAFTLGFEFTVANTTSLTALGVYDSGQDGLDSAAQVGVWDATGDLLLSATVPSGTDGTLDNDFRFVSVSSFTLTAGTDYVIGAYLADGSASSLGTDQGGAGSVDPNVIIIEDSYTNSSSLSFPNASDGHSGGAWLGANFETGAAGVPEPASWALMICGFGLAGAALRHRRIATA
jgi:Domain of unknown function (DUF4082)/PEP-CTERM motif